MTVLMRILTTEQVEQTQLRALQTVIHHFTLKSVENIEMTKKDLKNEDASMRLALYKSYFMSNLSRIELNYTANFV